MASNRAMIPVLVGLMLLTGMCNTLFTKYQDMQCVANCDSPDPRKHKTFEQPVIQTLQMFIGECGCWLVVFASYIYSRFFKSSTARDDIAYQPINGDAETEPLTHSRGNIGEIDEEIDPTDAPFKPFVDAEAAGAERIPLKGWNITLLALPACCDIAGTTLMNVGLLFVAASIYQMTRGTLVLFVGLFSVIFLKRHLALYKWLSLCIVVSGVAVVGVAGALEHKLPQVPGDNDHGAANSLASLARDVVVAAKEHSPIETVVGIALIAFAQTFTASQFVIEEKIMATYELDPLATVGWEGLFGFLVTALGMVILHFAVGRTEAGRGGYFDAKEGLSQFFNNRAIVVSGLLTMVSIGGFNFFGLSVTRTVSATSRSTIDTCRTLFIWVVSLGLGWESFKWLQVLGFALLVYGTMVFNDIVRPPALSFLRKNIALGEETSRPRDSSEGR